ncbi:hypothetical protein JCM13210_14040 [Thermaerobacter litoralis]
MRCGRLAWYQAFKRRRQERDRSPGTGIPWGAGPAAGAGLVPAGLAASPAGAWAGLRSSVGCTRPFPRLGAGLGAGL